jgi:hypothetical protein
MSDDVSRLHDLTDTAFLTQFNSTYPQKASWELWTPTPSILSAVTLSLLNVPPELTATGNSGPISVTNWLSTPYSPTSKIQFGRWRSHETLRYLHVQAEPTMRGFSARMLQHGSFVCSPITTSPASNFPPSEFPSMSHVSCPMLATLPSQSTMVPI